MRAIFGVLSLLIVLAVVGVLAKKQMSALSVPAATGGANFDASMPATTSRQQSQQLQDQVKRSVEATMQQARPEPDDK